MRWTRVLYVFLSIALAMCSTSVLAQAPSDVPGIASGTGTFFSATVSEETITLSTADSVDAYLQVAPGRGILFDVVPVSEATTLQVELGGLEPGRTYWLYTGGSFGGQQISADATGGMSLTLDTSQSRVRWLQTEPSTIYVTSAGVHYENGDPYPGATWDPATLTATLTQDVDETVRILGPGLTLDGAGHCIITAMLMGVEMGPLNTVKNLSITADWWALVATTGVIENVRAQTDPARFGSTALYQTGGCNRNCPVDELRVTGSAFSGSFALRNFHALRFPPVTMYGNSFVGLVTFIAVSTSTFYDPMLGGNYWSQYTGSDADGDGFGDTPFLHHLWRDEIPLMQPIQPNLPDCSTSPSTVVVGGSVSSDCDGALPGVSLILTAASGEEFAALTDAAGAYSFEVTAGSGPGTVAVAVPGGYETTAASFPVDLSADAAVDFLLSCIYVEVSGNVSSNCNGPALVTVDLAYGDTFLTTATAEDGSFLFDSIRWTEEAAEIGIVVPLGMASISPEFGHAAIVLTEDAFVPFSLDCLSVAGEVRSMGYWKHQARVYIHRKGTAQESETDMTTNFPNLMFSHFYENGLNSIDVAGVTNMDDGIGAVPVDLAQIEQTLTVNNGGSMLDRAKQQYLALLLNVASGKLPTWTVISGDGFTASQALQDIADRINNGEASDDELAKDVAELLNLGQTLPAGMIRDLWSNIAYKSAGAPPVVQAFALDQNTPNPFNPRTIIRFELPQSMPYELNVYDLAGRRVDHVRAMGQAGSNEITWDARGGALASGTYLYVLRSGGFVQSRRMVLLK